MIGIYGDDEGTLRRYVDFAVNVRSLPIVLVGPNLRILRRVASSFKGVESRAFDPDNLEVDSLVDTRGNSKILETVVRKCENVNYITSLYSVELERAASKCAAEAKSKKILISIGADLHSACTECALQNAANRLKVKKYSKLSDIQFGVHFQFHQDASLRECLSESSNTVLTILEGAKRSLGIENDKRAIPRTIKSIVSSGTQTKSYVSNFVPIVRSIQREKMKSELKNSSFVISLEKKSPWPIRVVFWVLSTWVFIFLVSHFDCIHRGLKQMVTRCRASQTNTSSHVLVWCHVEEMKRRAMYILDITSSSTLDVKCAVRIAENLLYRLPRRLAGSGALVLKRSGWRSASTAFGSDFASHLDSVNVVDDGWR